MTTTGHVDHHLLDHHLQDHEHDHPHDHPHVHEHEAGLPPQGGPVVVDIGGDVGALIVRLDHELLGTELHLRQDGWTHTVHTGVWDRPLGDRMVTVAVYPALVRGDLRDPRRGRGRPAHRRHRGRPASPSSTSAAEGLRRTERAGPDLLRPGMRSAGQARSMGIC